VVTSAAVKAIIPITGVVAMLPAVVTAAVAVVNVVLAAGTTSTTNL
jgi:hypothetical protein